MGSMLKRIVILCLILFLLAPAAQALESVVIEPGAERVPLGAQLSVLRDAPASHTLRELVRGEGAWQRSPSSDPVFGFDSAPYWFRVGLYNAGDRTREMRLELGNSRMDRIDAYLIRDGAVVARFETGDHRPYTQRPLPHRNFVFPLSMPPHTQTDVYLRVRSSSVITVPVTLWEQSALEAKTAAEQHWHIGFLALLATLALLAGALAAIKRSWALVGLAAYSMCAAFTHLIWQGHAFARLWPEWPGFNDKAVLFALLASFLTLLFFTKHLLNLGRLGGGLSRAYNVLAGALALLAAALLLLRPEQLAPTVATLVLLVPLLCLGTGIWAWLQGEPRGGGYTLGAAANAIAAAAGAFSTLGWANAAPQLDSAVRAFALLAVLLWLFATRTASEQRSEPVAAEDDAEAERSAADLAARDALEALFAEAAHARSAPQEPQPIEQDSRDLLTGLHTRRWFDDRYVQLWRRAMRGKTPLSLLLIDIDRFKLVNDHFGYRVGDACLSAVAQRLQALLPPDALARYGGEEFAVLLPETTNAQAEVLAGALVREVAELDFSALARGLTLSASIGAATLYHRIGPMNPDGLLNAADEALYEAKRRGGGSVYAAPAA